MASVGAAIVPLRGLDDWSSAEPHQAAGQPDDRRVIEVLARRYAFEPAVLEVTAGEPVRLVVRSADGVHGIGIDSLGIKRQIPRGGEAVTLEFVARQAGRFPIVCSEYCGNGHEEMKGTLVVHAREGAGSPPQERR